MKNYRLVGCIVALFGALMLPQAALSQSTQPNSVPGPGKSPGNGPASGPEVNLRPKFTKGQEVRFKMTMRSTVPNSIPSTDEEADVAPPEATEQEMVIVLKPKEVNPETGSTLEMVYESIKIEMGEVKFDSKKPADPLDPTDEIFRSILKLKLKVQMDVNGNITSITNDAQEETFNALLEQQFTGAEVVKGLFGPITSSSVSDGTARVGETWETNDSMMGLMGTTRLSMRHTLESVRNGKATIKTKGKVVLDGSPSSGLPVANVKDSKIEGTTEWDVNGRMLSKMTQENTIIVQVGGLEGRAATQTHRMKVEVTRVR